tara:strand:- start:3091 stop:3675 length:585 start_codon:yes stop_codon:yes gene_type:complete
MEKKRGLIIIVILILILAGFYFFIRPTHSNLELASDKLDKYTKEILLDSYLPKNLIVEHKLIGTGSYRGTNYTYGALWDVDTTQMYAFFHYNKNNDVSSDIGIFFQIDDLINLNEDVASSLLQKYFKKDYAVKCETALNGVIICEDFIEEESIKYGVGVAKIENTTLIFSCEHFEGGNIFAMESCMRRSENEDI